VENTDRFGAGDPDDAAGLFGPDSVTWQLHADPMMWVAGVRGLYLQALYPRAVRGVMQNSDFRRDPWGRLIRTADYIGVTTYGTKSEAQRAGARIRRIHARMQAVDPETGETYRIDDPTLLRWIHCAEVASYLEVTRRSGYPLTDGQADLYLQEQRKAAVLVGLQRDEVPGSVSEMSTYFTGVRPVLADSAEAQEVWRFLRRPPVPPLLWLGREMLWRQLAELAYGSLPWWAQKLYGRRGLPSFAVTAGLQALRRTSSAVIPLVRVVYPSPHIGAAIERLGPEVLPSPERLPSPAPSPAPSAALK
jgi:uncharacterized protein (DUF2236 family)